MISFRTIVRLWRIKKIGRAQGVLLKQAIALEDVALINGVAEFGRTFNQFLKVETERVERTHKLRKLSSQI